jgi:hypothetical protein
MEKFKELVQNELHTATSEVQRKEIACKYTIQVCKDLRAKIDRLTEVELAVSIRDTQQRIRVIRESLSIPPPSRPKTRQEEFEEMSTKKRRMETVWVLTITHGVDDYKSRGECASSTVKLYKTEKSCEMAVLDYIVEQIVECEFDRIPDELNTCEKNGEVFFIKEDGAFSMNEAIPKEWFPIKKLFGFVAKGEYIPYRWTYEIKEMPVHE